MTPRDDIDASIKTLIGNGTSYAQAAEILGLTKGVVTHRVRMMREAQKRAHEARRLAQLRTVAPDITRALGKGPPMIPRAVDRTPCVRCGVRADVGCVHSHAWGWAA